MLSNVGDPSWRWNSKYYAQVQQKKANLFVACLRPQLKRETSQAFFHIVVMYCHVVMGKKCTKERDARAVYV